MASYAPPTAILPFFNPAVFETDETALTLGEANKIYFKRSGGIITGPVSAPSLTLNGTNVETKLLEIDANSNKLTDISYNNNTTSILNDLSINGILKLPNLPNVGNDISSNKQKTTKISYDANTSVTTIADTLKAGSTLIVGSQNYNASDEFYKLIGVSRGATPLLTITDAVDLNGILNLPNHGNIDTVLSNFDEILVNMTYTSGPSNLLNISSNVKIPQNLELGTITDVEQKILDVSNSITPYISYDSVNDKIVVEKDVDLSTNDLTCNFMRPIAGGRYGLSHNWNESYLLFRNGGHTIDAFNSADDTGRTLFLNFYARSNVIIGSHLTNSTTTINGDLKITETTGTAPTASGGSLTLSHGNNSGTSSIVFKNSNDLTETDFGYISYQDDYLNATIHRGLLEIGIQNDPVGSGQIDNIALMPSGFVGINTRTPQTMLDVNGDTKISGNLELGTITDVEQKIIDISNNAGGVPSITYDAVTETTTFDGSSVVMPQLTIRPEVDLQDAVQEIYSKNGTATLKLGDDNGTTKTFSNILKSENGNATFYGNNSGETKFMEYNSTDDKINISKDMDLGGNILYIDNLYIQETTGTPPTGQKGSLTLTHDDAGGTSSIVFRSARDSGVDHGYISYQDDYDGSTTLDRSLLEIGCKNDSGTNTIDNIAIMPSGFVGINTRTPEYMLDISGGDMRIHGVLLEQRPFEPYGYGICLRTLLNPPDTSGGIFEVRSTNGNCRLFCGQTITSSAKNPFFFGYNGSDGQEALSSKYTGKLDLDGSVDCTEIKVNNIPINSFTSFKLGTNYNNSVDWGQGIKMSFNNLTSDSTHSQLFTEYYNPPPFVIPTFEFTCNFLGTYEIYADVIYRNESGARHNPCIGIDIDNDISTTTSGLIAPNWSYTPFSETPFSVQYVRMGEGRVASLHAKRTHTFTSTSEKVSILQFIETSGGTDFTDLASGFIILVATLKFKYIGNF